MIQQTIQAIWGAITLTCAAFAMPVAAQQPMQLNSDVKVVKSIVNEDGTTVTALVDPEVVVPGDRVIFGTEYSNSGPDPVENIIVTNPLPAAVSLAEDADPDLSVSVDGGITWGRLAELQVTQNNGEVRPAAPADVTHVRWILAVVGPGESGRLEYSAIIR